MDSEVVSKVFSVDEVLMTIFSFVLGTDIDNMGLFLNIHLVSSRFYKFLVEYMKYIPLQLYWHNDISKTRGFYKSTVYKSNLKWLMKNNIDSRVHGFFLYINLEYESIDFVKDFNEFDFRNLEYLSLCFNEDDGRNESFISQIFLIFAKANLIELNISCCGGCIQFHKLYPNFLQQFHNLNSLEISLLDYPFEINMMVNKLRKLKYLNIQGALRGFSLSSKSIKHLDLSRCITTITSLECPSLELLICTNPTMICKKFLSNLSNRFGNSDEEYSFDECHTLARDFFNDDCLNHDRNILDKIPGLRHPFDNPIQNKDIKPISIFSSRFVTSCGGSFLTNEICQIVSFTFFPDESDCPMCAGKLIRYT